MCQCSMLCVAPGVSYRNQVGVIYQRIMDRCGCRIYTLRAVCDRLRKDISLEGAFPVSLSSAFFCILYLRTPHFHEREVCVIISLTIPLHAAQRAMAAIPFFRL